MFDGRKRGEALSESKPVRILVVEDDADVGDLLDMALSSLVGAVTTSRAENGLVALRRIENDPPYDLVLCDIMMPGLDGARLLRDLDARRAFRGQRVLLLSAVPESQVTDLLHIPEVAGYLQKPVDPIRLAEKVRELLDGR